MRDAAVVELDDPIFRETVRRFIAAEIAPHHARWEGEGRDARDL